MWALWASGTTRTFTLATSDTKPSRSMVRTPKRNEPAGKPLYVALLASVNALHSSAGP